jgi:hypothetical protein
MTVQAKRVCVKCGLETDWPEGSYQCPVYHGYTGAGFCPIFVDGLTREEQSLHGANDDRPSECMPVHPEWSEGFQA